MSVSIPAILIDLIKTASVVVVFAYTVTRARFFSDVLNKHFNLGSQILTTLLFGKLSIFGTYGGITLPSGAIANMLGR